jgi:imidazolonepropionase-like amidohydrolase
VIAGVEPYRFQVPQRCVVSVVDGTLLPGLIDAHTHLVADSEVGALGRVAGYSEQQLDQVINKALGDHLRAGVTTVRDLGDRWFRVAERSAHHDAAKVQPTIVASGPPITSRGGHCHFLGGEVTGPGEIIRAVDERAQRGVDVVKVMASGGITTPDSDVTLPQFTSEELGLLVQRAHDAGLPVTAHAHATRAVELAIAAGVDGIEHCSCVTARGFGQVTDETIGALASSEITVCPTVGLDPATHEAPPDLQAVLDRMGVTYDQWWQSRLEFVGRLHSAGVRLVSGADSGISQAKRHGILPQSVCDLVTAGLDVTEALSTATSVGAVVCGLGAHKGRLTPGYDADLVTVEGDLDKDVTALLRPQNVVLAGTSVPL